MGEVSLRFKYTEEEYISALRLYMLRSSNVLFRLIAFSLLVAGGVFFILLMNLDSQTYIFFILVGVIWLLFLFFILYAVPRQRFRSNPKYRDEYFLQFSEDGIHFRTAQIDSLIQWSFYSRVLENDRFYLMIDDKNIISVIPKRAFRSEMDEEAFRELLRRKIPSYSSYGRLNGRASGQLEKPYEPPAEPPDWR